MGDPGTRSEMSPDVSARGSGLTCPGEACRCQWARSCTGSQLAEGCDLVSLYLILVSFMVLFERKHGRHEDLSHKVWKFDAFIFISL